MRASIITPTFNAVRFIDDCVANVRSQGGAVLEHIVVDGGSTDGTVERIVALQASEPALRFVPGPDRGQSDALNKGVAAARGDVIGVLNVDDTYEPRVVANACDLLAKASEPAFVVGDCKMIEPDRIKWNRPKDLRFEALLLGYDYAQWPNNPASYFYHRAVHDIVGPYDVDDHYSMDLDFIFRCARAVQMRYVPQHWGNFYLHPGCKTFDDDAGIQRQQKLLDRFQASLSAAELSRMLRIKASKSRVLAIKAFLKRSPLLRAVNDRLATR